MKRLVLLAAALAACASPLTRAAQDGDLGALRSLIAAGENLEATDSNGETPLMKAAITGRVDAAKVLLDAGADPNHGTMFGTPLGYATQFHHAELAALLIARGAAPTAEAAALAKRAVHPSADAPAPAAAAAVPASAPASAPASDVDRATETGAERPDDFALVIGVEEYQSLPKADYGVRDARAVRRHLAALGVPERNIVSLEGPQATKSKLEGYLQDWLPLNAKEDSTLWVYYSGHGAPDPVNGKAYLVPWDGDPMFLKRTAYPLERFYADLAKTKAKRVVVALDACFSGTGGRSVLAKGARPLVVKVDQVAPGAANMTVLAAASGDQIAGTLDAQGHGAFTYYLLKGLSGAAKDPRGEVTPRSLYDYMSPRVQDEARRQNREQTPTLAGRKEDDPL